MTSEDWRELAREPYALECAVCGVRAVTVNYPPHPDAPALSCGSCGEAYMALPVRDPVPLAEQEDAVERAVEAMWSLSRQGNDRWADLAVAALRAAQGMEEEEGR